MYHQQSYAGQEPAFKQYGRRMHPHAVSFNRAPVNVYKTETSYEMLVFAPGRTKENFQVNVAGDEIIISYEPVPANTTPNWVHKEYSRGAFERRFKLDEGVDTTNIAAKYEDGVLWISLPVIPGKEVSKKEIPIS